MKPYNSAPHVFSQVPRTGIQRSSFDRSHGIKSTFDAGYLIPFYVDEVLPGDTFNLNLTAFARMATPIKPVMDNLYMDVFYFFAPLRLLWTNFPKFMGEQTNPGDSISYNVPQMTGPAGAGIVTNSLSDYLGLPTGKASVVFDSLWHRMYNKTWNQWFRDENLQNSVTEDMGDGPDTYSNYSLLRRGKRHDYFTSCLPWAQKGTAVSVPLGSVANIIETPSTTAANKIVKASNGAVTGSNENLLTEGAAAGNLYGATSGVPLRIVPNGAWVADLTNATASTINTLRLAFQTQKFLERDARGGTRYTEIVRSHFDVVSPDARLQRIEYLGGGSTRINVNPVAQTTPTPAAGTTTPQGNLAAFGTVAHQGSGFNKSFVEHGILMGLVSVRADLTYQQGLDRMFRRRTRYDFYWPTLAHIGEQAVLNEEIYCNMDANDALVFGYQERYAEYRYKPSKVTGLFRSNVTAGFTSIEQWHLAQNFGSLPTLGDTFIKDTPPVSRVIVTSTEPQFLFDAFIDLKCARPMPVYSVPGMIDRF